MYIQKPNELTLGHLLFRTNLVRGILALIVEINYLYKLDYKVVLMYFLFNLDISIWAPSQRKFLSIKSQEMYFIQSMIIVTIIYVSIQYNLHCLVHFNLSIFMF